MLYKVRQIVVTSSKQYKITRKKKKLKTNATIIWNKTKNGWQTCVQKFTPSNLQSTQKEILSFELCLQVLIKCSENRKNIFYAYSLFVSKISQWYEQVLLTNSMKSKERKNNYPWRKDHKYLVSYRFLIYFYIKMNPIFHVSKMS